jgi:hypothetical protein
VVNSSGKSSLIQSLLLLKQTVQSPDRSIHLNLGGDEVNDLFNFGSFENVLSQGVEGERTFTIDFTFTPEGHVAVPEASFHCIYGQNSAGGRCSAGMAALHGLGALSLDQARKRRVLAVCE